MRERCAQIVLLIRAFEEADPDGVVVPLRARTAATRRALRVTGLADWTGDLYEAHNIRNGEMIVRRSRLLFESLTNKTPGLGGILHVARLGLTTAPAIVGTALVLGLATNALGPHGQVNLLSAPLIGILAWNLGIYLARLAAPLTARVLAGRFDRAKADGRGVAAYLAGLFLKGAVWRRLHWKSADGRDRAVRHITARSVVRFGALWRRCAGALLAARVRRMLHVGALTLALGTMGGMYLRGVTLEYRATWESTWLDAGQVKGLMNTMLGPAATVLGTTVPEVAPLRSPGDGSAAPWIHLYAVTLLLLVVLPRAGLALAEALRCVRLAADLPVDLGEGYFRRLLRDWRGEATSIEIVPYSYSPEPASVTRLESWLRDFFGARADVRLRAPLAYGDGAGELVEPAAEGGPWTPPSSVGDDLAGGTTAPCYVVMFNLAQSPEAEVHGAFLEELKSHLGDHRAQLLVVLDVLAYGGRGRDRSRTRERLRAWQRVGRQTQLEAVELDAASEEESSTEQLSRSIWPRKATSGKALP